MKDAHSISTRRAYGVQRVCRVWHRARSKALFMTVWCPDSRSVESNCGIPRG